MQAEEYVVQKQTGVELQKDGHKEKIASFKTPEEPKMTASGCIAREKLLDKTTVTRVGPTEKVVDVITTDGVQGERVQVFKKPIEKERIKVYKEDLQQEKIVVAKQPLAMKPVGKEKVVEVLDTDDMATGAHQLAATSTKTKHKGSLHKTLDVLSTENERGEQRIIEGEDVEKVLGHDQQRDRSDSSSSSSSSSESEKHRHRKHKKHHRRRENQDTTAVAVATNEDVVAAAVAKDVGR